MRSPFLTLMNEQQQTVQRLLVQKNLARAVTELVQYLQTNHGCNEVEAYVVSTALIAAIPQMMPPEEIQLGVDLVKANPPSQVPIEKIEEVMKQLKTNN